MGSRLTDIKVRFIADEDRLLMRIAASDHDEVRLWLTRRFVEAILGVFKGHITQGGNIPRRSTNWAST